MSGSKLNQDMLNQVIAYYGNDGCYLSSKTKTNLISGSQSGKSIRWPLVVLIMGQTAAVQGMAASVLGRRSLSLSEAHFYQVKSLLLRLFGRELNYQPERHQPPEHYQKDFRSCLKSVRSVSPRQQSPKMPLLDEFVATLRPGQ